MQHLLPKFRLALVISATIALAQATVVTGTGNPAVDVPAVQAAANAGGDIVLMGHFSFDTPPTVPTPLQAVGIPPATILISKAVAISGAPNASIEAGTIPFYVQAPGASVSIQKVRFVRPAKSAILVYAVSGLLVASCRIDGITPLPNIQFSGISIGASDMATIPTPSKPGHPEKLSGRIEVVNNDLDFAGGTVFDNVLGVTAFSAGQSPDKEVDLYITGNRIRNITQPAINLRRIGGRARVESNVITTGNVSSPTTRRPEAIRAANTGSYVIAHNVIHSEWPAPEAIGIGVFSQAADWPIADAEIVDNEVTMLPPDGVRFGAFSAGIDIRGFAQGVVVGNNRIRGRARAAVAVDVSNGGSPRNTAFILNHFDDLEASVPGVVVGNGVRDTLIVGEKGTVDDHGIHTVILPIRGRQGLTSPNRPYIGAPLTVGGELNKLAWNIALGRDGQRTLPVGWNGGEEARRGITDLDFAGYGDAVQRAVSRGFVSRSMTGLR